MGAVAALLAGACVAPVVIQVVLFSSNLYATGTTIALALPFFLGLGMALPWPIRRRGPRLAAEAGHVDGARQAGLRRRSSSRPPLYYGYLAYALFAEPLGRSGRGAVERRGAAEGRLARRRSPRASPPREREGKPVLIDMWATWCKNCLTMDKTTLVDRRCKAALAGYVKIKFQAEDPDESAGQGRDAALQRRRPARPTSSSNRNDGDGIRSPDVASEPQSHGTDERVPDQAHASSRPCSRSG